MAFSPKTLPLDAAQVESFRAKIDDYIDARVAEIAKGCPGVPAAAIRNTLIRGNCQCDAFLQMKAKDDAQKGAA